MKTKLLVLLFMLLVSFTGTQGVVMAENKSAAAFDPNALFPTWDDSEEGKVQGIIGENGESDLDPSTTLSNQNPATKTIVFFIPKLIDFLLVFVAPMIMIFLIYAGYTLIVAGDDEDSIGKAKSYIKYCLIGLIIILISYSMIKAVYQVLLPDEAPTSTANSTPSS